MAARMIANFVCQGLNAIAYTLFIADTNAVPHCRTAVMRLMLMMMLLIGGVVAVNSHW